MIFSVRIAVVMVMVTAMEILSLTPLASFLLLSKSPVTGLLTTSSLFFTFAVQETFSGACHYSPIPGIQ